MNLYADLAMFEDQIVNNATLDTADAAVVERMLDASSRRVDEICRRHFYDLTATRVLDGNGRDRLRIPDLLAATSIKLDEDGDRTFELTLASATDYYLKRHGYEDEDATPYTMLELDGVNGQRSTFVSRKRLVEIVGRWGFTDETEAVEASGTAITGTLADATDLTLAVSADADLAVGQTLKLEDEQVYISGGTTSPFTVVRGVNGTTAAAHAAVAVNRYVYVPQVREATLILAARLWKRRDTSYANVIAQEAVGRFEVFKQFDPDVVTMLSPLVRGDALVGAVA